MCENVRRYRFCCKRKQEEEQLYRELQFDDPVKGECRITCSGAMATFLYPYLLERQKSHSALILAVEAAPNQLIIQNILTNKVDLDIVTLPTSSSELEIEALDFESLCLVLPRSYSDRPLSFSSLQKFGFIDHPDGSHYVSRLLSANFKGHFQGVEKLNKTGYINQILLPVSEGLGFTVLPETVIRHFPQQSSLYLSPIDHPIRDELFLVTKKYRALPKCYDWFVEKSKSLSSHDVAEKSLIFIELQME
jgi:DNA-binding transcriptional LysR family regulator